MEEEVASCDSSSMPLLRGKDSLITSLHGERTKYRLSYYPIIYCI